MSTLCGKIPGGGGQVVLGWNPLVKHNREKATTAKGKVAYAGNLDVPRMFEAISAATEKRGGVAMLVAANACPAPVSVEAGDLVAPKNYLKEFERHKLLYDRVIGSMGGLVKMARYREELSYLLEAGTVVFYPSVEGWDVPTDPTKAATAKQREVETRRDLAALDTLFLAYNVVNFGLSWNEPVKTVTTCYWERKGLTDEGIKPYGREVIIPHAISRGAILDISHSSHLTQVQLLEEFGHAKIMGSHVGLNTVTPHARNIDPTIAVGIVESGGGLGVPWVGLFIQDNERPEQVSVDNLVAHVRGFRNEIAKSQVIHIDPVSRLWMGPDLGGTGYPRRTPQLANVATGYEIVAEALFKTGEYNEDQIKGVLGNNLRDHMLERMPSITEVYGAKVVTPTNHGPRVIVPSYLGN